MKYEKEKGITLIALVITIIVLLILAGISISMLTGDNSILNQAANAKEKTSIAQIEENINLAVIGALASSKGSTITESTLVSELNSYFGSDGYTITGNATTDWKITVDSVSRYVSSNGDITEPVTNPYDEDGWTIAYTCTDGVWSDAIEAGETAEGDIVAKFYATENTITPPDLDVSYDGTPYSYSFQEGTEYYLVIEGKGEMSQLAEIDVDSFTVTSAYAWWVENAMYILGYSNTCILPYVTEITVCEGITNIGQCAFLGSMSLKSVSIGHTVTSIDAYAFCFTELSSVTIPNSVTTIGDCAFYENRLTSVTIGNSVTTIGEYAFSGNQLASVTIGNSVTSIGWEAFYSSDYETVYYYKGTISELCSLADKSGWYYYDITYIFGNKFTNNDSLFHCSDGNISWSDLINSY